MAKAGYSKTISSNETRKKELECNFPLGKELVNKYGTSLTVIGYWGDRCIVASDNNIYNVEYDLGYKFNYSRITR